MNHYNTFSDYEKQKKIREVKNESNRLSKPKYWILKQMNIPKSTYYDWLRNEGKTKSRAPLNVWNKTIVEVENEIIKIRCDSSLYRSQRSCLGISGRLETKDVYISKSGVWQVLKRKGENRKFVDHKKTFIIYPKSQKFLKVVCIDDVGLTNKKPRELSIFNAIDEYSQELVGILFVGHRINRYDVIKLLEIIKKKYGRLPKIVRLDNAQAHHSLLVKEYCRENNIVLQFIDPGAPQQNWPVESFNGVLRRDLLSSRAWGGWSDLSNKQEVLDSYMEYYNNVKRLDSDYLKRTPKEISTANTSVKTQRRLKLKLIRKHYGQTMVPKVIIDKNINDTEE